MQMLTDLLESDLVYQASQPSSSSLVVRQWTSLRSKPSGPWLYNILNSRNLSRRKELETRAELVWMLSIIVLCKITWILSAYYCTSWTSSQPISAHTGLALCASTKNSSHRYISNLSLFSPVKYDNKYNPSMENLSHKFSMASHIM